MKTARESKRKIGVTPPVGDDMGMPTSLKEDLGVRSHFLPHAKQVPGPRRVQERPQLVNCGAGVHLRRCPILYSVRNASGAEIREAGTGPGGVRTLATITERNHLQADSDRDTYEPYWWAARCP